MNLYLVSIIFTRLLFGTLRPYCKVEMKVNKLYRSLVKSWCVRALNDDSIVQLIQESDECYCKVLSPLSDIART